MAPWLYYFWLFDNKYFPSPDSYVAQLHRSNTFDMVTHPIGNLFMAATELSRNSSEVINLFRSLVPDSSVRTAEHLPTTRAQQNWLIKTDHGLEYILSLPNRPGATPLSLEKTFLVAESLLLHWLSSMPCYDSNSLLELQGDYEVISRHGSLNYVALFLPCMQKHAHHDFEKSRPEYLLTQPTPGVTISDLNASLTMEERAIIGYQSGCLMRRICSHISPNGKFGSVKTVLQAYFKQAPGIRAGDGFNTWAEAFQWMLESVVEDLKGKGIMIPYIEIQAHLQRLLHILNGIKRPSLVVLDAAEDSNVLVERRATALDRPHEAMLKGSTTILEHGIVEEHAIEDGDLSIGINGFRVTENSRTGMSSRVSGLRNWGNSIFGDPLMAVVFARELPRAFVRGLREPLPSYDPFSRTNPIEDAPRIEARSALYQCFHGLTLIAQNFYHYHVPPNMPEEEDLQLIGRRQIKTALRRLDAVDDVGNSRRS